MKVHGHSSQTVFLPRQFSFSSGNHTPNGHVFSSRTSALRAASSEPSAVGPYGGCAQRSLVALTSPLELVSGLTAIAKTRPTSYWLAPPATLKSDLRCWDSSRAPRALV